MVMVAGQGCDCFGKSADQLSRKYARFFKTCNGVLGVAEEQRVDSKSGTELGRAHLCKHNYVC